MIVIQRSLLVNVLHDDHMDILILKADGSWVDSLHPIEYDNDVDMILGVTSLKN